MTDLLKKTIDMITPLDEEMMAKAQARQDDLIKPQGSLGVLERISIRLAGIQGKAIPQINQKAVITMAGDHGVVAEKVGNWPQEVTAQMVQNFLAGGAAINVVTKQVGARVAVVDMGVASDVGEHPNLIVKKIAAGTQNIAKGAAMTREQAVQAVEAGINVLNGEAEKGLDIVATGDMGIGNTTPSAAIYAVMMGKTAVEVTGRGTGLSDEQLVHKAGVVQQAIDTNQPNKEDALDVLAKVGGFEIGGLAGVMVGAAARRIPVVVDGFISTAAALIAVGLEPKVKGYLFAGHRSAEQGHRLALEHLKLEPIVDLEMRLGEGTGGALGIFIAETAVKILRDMATFSGAGVSEKEE